MEGASLLGWRPADAPTCHYQRQERKDVRSRQHELRRNVDSVQLEVEGQRLGQPEGRRAYERGYWPVPRQDYDHNRDVTPSVCEIPREHADVAHYEPRSGESGKYAADRHS